MGYSQYKPLGFWNKAMPSIEKYMTFKKQVLEYYWALVETEHLTMGHQVKMHSELSLLLDSTNYTLRHA